MSMNNFLDLPLKERKEYIKNLLQKNPTLIPVILTADPNSTLINQEKRR